MNIPGNQRISTITFSRRTILAVTAMAAAGATTGAAWARGATVDRSVATEESTMSEPRVLIDGLAFPESPRWHEDRLWFCDWGAGEIIAVDLEGHRETVISIESFPMSIDWLPDGRLLVLAASSASLLVRQPDGSLETYADLTALGEHPWNELVVDGRGNAYVNNIGFDFPEGEFALGIVALVTPDGEARQIADGVSFPNGMAVTPDNATLILAESYANQLTAFDIGKDGDLSNRRVWADLKDGYPDGICLDAEGAVWYGDVPNQRCARVLEGGEVLQSIQLDRGCFACALGGKAGRTLFLVANTWGEEAAPDPAGQVLAVEAPAAAAGWP